MNRRDILHLALAPGALAVFGASASEAHAGAAQTAVDLPRRRQVKVAFMIGANANVIDTAGPWEVFQDASRRKGPHVFSLYTVAPTRETVVMTGGLRVQPHYSIADAPQPHVIVVPAQISTEASRAWLARASANADVTMSVCTGAFQLARAGLVNSVPVTTHHEFWDAFAREFPHIELRRGLRFVDSGRIATAGGLTSGIDLALHIVGRYFGHAVAADTARYMEHSSEAWAAGA